MEETVYADILFLINFCMDFQGLFLTAKLLRRPIFLLRLLLLSVFGAFYACVALFLSVSGPRAFCLDVAVCFLMCVGSFWKGGSGFRAIFAPLGVYFMVSLAIGGVMSGTATLLSRISFSPGAQTRSLGTGAFFALAAVGGGATCLWARLCQRRAKGMRAELSLCLRGRSLTVRCMVDTANFLKDPVGGRAVVLLEREAARGFLEEELLEAERTGGVGALSSLPPSLARRVRLIPAGSALGNGLLMAVAPDAAFLDAGRGRVPVEVLVAPARLELAGQGCEALLPAELITQ